jgi:hypothetical protein
VASSCPARQRKSHERGRALRSTLKPLAPAAIAEIISRHDVRLCFTPRLPPHGAWPTMAARIRRMREPQVAGRRALIARCGDSLVRTLWLPLDEASGRNSVRTGLNSSRPAWRLRAPAVDIECQSTAQPRVRCATDTAAGCSRRWPLRRQRAAARGGTRGSRAPCNGHSLRRTRTGHHRASHTSLFTPAGM